MSGPFDPYYYWLGIPPSEQPPNHYRLLGIAAFEESPAVIQNAADQRMAHLRTFQAGKHAAESQRLLNEVATAKICLLNPEKKTAYDKELAKERRGDNRRDSETTNSPPGSVVKAKDRAMDHTAEISRANPTCFLLLVDQSGSMAERFGGDSGRSKAEGVAEAVNRLLQTLVYRCAKGVSILDRYYVGVIGYGGEVRSGFPITALADNVLQPISRIGANPLRIEERIHRIDDGAGGLRDQCFKLPVWFEPRAQGKTPMCAALRAARDVLVGFIGRYPGCFPPIIINISDGLATDGALEPEAQALRSLASEDGNALLFNLHLTARGETPILFPSHDTGLPDDYARRLFSISSLLPPKMLHQARIQEATLSEGSRGFAFNADLASVVMFLDIGTRIGSSPC